jgi:preprotein translocase subunit SecE
MGRIQRKKTSGKPKVKAAKSQETAAPQNGNRAPAKSTSQAAASRQTAKAPVNYPGKKYVDASVQFLREVRVELRKVTWPSRKQTVGSTVVVIVLVLLISAFLGLVDMGLSGLINMVIQ